MDYTVGLKATISIYYKINTNKRRALAKSILYVWLVIYYQNTWWSIQAHWNHFIAHMVEWQGARSNSIRKKKPIVYKDKGKKFYL